MNSFISIKKQRLSDDDLNNSLLIETMNLANNTISTDNNFNNTISTDNNFNNTDFNSNNFNNTISTDNNFNNTDFNSNNFNNTILTDNNFNNTISTNNNFNNTISTNNNSNNINQPSNYKTQYRQSTSNKSIVSEDFISECSDDIKYYENSNLPQGLSGDLPQGLSGDLPFEFVKYFELSDDEDDYYDNNFDNILDVEDCQHIIPITNKNITTTNKNITTNPTLNTIKTLVSDLQFNKALELYDSIILKDEYFNHIFEELKYGYHVYLFKNTITIKLYVIRLWIEKLKKYCYKVGTARNIKTRIISLNKEYCSNGRIFLLYLASISTIQHEINIHKILKRFRINNKLNNNTFNNNLPNNNTFNNNLPNNNTFNNNLQNNNTFNNNLPNNNIFNNNNLDNNVELYDISIELFKKFDIIYNYYSEKKTYFKSSNYLVTNNRSITDNQNYVEIVNFNEQYYYLENEEKEFIEIIINNLIYKNIALKFQQSNVFFIMDNGDNETSYWLINKLKYVTI